MLRFRATSKYLRWMPALVRTLAELKRASLKNPHLTKHVMICVSKPGLTPGSSLSNFACNISLHTAKYPLRYTAHSSLMAASSPLSPNCPPMATIFSSWKKSTSKGK